MYRVVYCLMLIGLSACGGETPSSQLPYFTSTDMTPVFISDGNVDSSFLKQVHSFSLVGQDGDRVTEASLSNRPYVANFFFTECTGICPTLRTRLTAVQKAFDSDDLTMLSVSIADEDQDLSKLKAYSKVNGIQSEMWKLVTGDSNAIQHLALDSFGARLDLNGIYTRIQKPCISLMRMDIYAVCITGHSKWRSCSSLTICRFSFPKI